MSKKTKKELELENAELRGKVEALEKMVVLLQALLPKPQSVPVVPQTIPSYPLIPTWGFDVWIGDNPDWWKYGSTTRASDVICGGPQWPNSGTRYK